MVRTGNASVLGLVGMAACAAPVVWRCHPRWKVGGPPVMEAVTIISLLPPIPRFPWMTVLYGSHRAKRKPILAH